MALTATRVLEHGELIEAIELGRPAPRSAYVKVRERESYEYALASAAATVELDDGGRIESARIALGSVALRPWRLTEAEHRIAGLAPDDPAVTAALEAALAAGAPRPRQRLQDRDRPRGGAPRPYDRSGGSPVSALLGASLPRQDGPAKVTGAARYAGRPLRRGHALRRRGRRHRSGRAAARD